MVSGYQDFLYGGWHNFSGHEETWQHEETNVPGTWRMTWTTRQDRTRDGSYGTFGLH